MPHKTESGRLLAGDRRWLAAIAVVAMGLRVGWIAAAGGDLRFADEHGHVSIARSVAEGRGFVDGDGNHAQRMPFYPLYLAIFINQ